MEALQNLLLQTDKSFNDPRLKFLSPILKSTEDISILAQQFQQTRALSRRHSSFHYLMILGAHECIHYRGI